MSIESSAKKNTGSGRSLSEAQGNEAVGNAAESSYLLAFDTANEVIAIGIGLLKPQTQSIELIAACETPAHRSSNTKLLTLIDELMNDYEIDKSSLACVACGRGPGSFTGVRIGMATAKGIASALEVPLWGISTLDAIAWQLQNVGIRGNALVVADAMRKEVYPVRYVLRDKGIERLDADSVIKAEEFAKAGTGLTSHVNRERGDRSLSISGDALLKYSEEFQPLGTFVDKDLWTPTGKGLLLTVEAAWQADEIDPYDRRGGDPALALPVYTRLSDAEENERIRLSKNDPKNLQSGVQEEGIRRDQRAVRHDSAILNAQPDGQGITYRPLDAAHAQALASLEIELMGSDAWNESMVLDELTRKDRVWWAAYSEDKQLIAYAGGWVVDGVLHILKVGTKRDYQRLGIARKLLAELAYDARDLGAKESTLEVRISNAGAQEFYARLGFENIGTRPGYYSDKESALIMTGPLPLEASDVAGMQLQFLDEEESSSATRKHPLILAIETSCDETAAAVVDGSATLISNVVASQIDFHARFGGVVPEIASRKHIEALCGVTQVCLETAAEALGAPSLKWRDLDAIAVTYTPGLVGALVVGLAFAKGASWAIDKPLIGVNHLEGHIYANKMAEPTIKPPMIVSLVSGGHTMLVLVKGWGRYETLGSTLDDAVGEAFDKVAKVMGLGYPGGPAIGKLAEKGNPNAIDFPRAMLHSKDFRFSLSGLKTAVITYIHKEEAAGQTLNKADIAASFQQAVIDVQVAKAEAALKQTGAKEFCLGGGVAANQALREAYEEMAKRLDVRVTLPPLSACTDNAGMIALVALDRYQAGRFLGLDADAYAQADLDKAY